MHIMDLVIALAKVVICMALGFFLNKIKILSADSNNIISRFILNVTLPCTMFAAVAGMETREMGTVRQLIIIGFGIYIFLGIAAFIITKLIKMGKESEGVVQCLLMFGNVSFLGIPLVQALYGDAGVFYNAILNVHFNIFCFTYGVWLMARSSGGRYKLNFKSFLSPALISIVFALILYLFGVSVPDVIMEPVEFIGQITSPLAMITIGSIIATYSLKELFSQGKLYILAAFKMLILPAIAYIIMYFITGPGLVASVVTIYIAMPTANTISMMAVTYKSDPKTATCGTGLMNILCIVTIPLIYMLMNYIG